MHKIQPKNHHFLVENVKIPFKKIIFENGLVNKKNKSIYSYHTGFNVKIKILCQRYKIWNC